MAPRAIAYLEDVVGGLVGETVAAERGGAVDAEEVLVVLTLARRSYARPGARRTRRRTPPTAGRAATASRRARPPAASPSLRNEGVAGVGDDEGVDEIGDPPSCFSHGSICWISVVHDV